MTVYACQKSPPNSSIYKAFIAFVQPARSKHSWSCGSQARRYGISGLELRHFKSVPATEGTAMNIVVPDRISHLDLLTEFVRRTAEGWQSDDPDYYGQLVYELLASQVRVYKELLDYLDRQYSL
jgi:hypothetical protein